MAGYEALSWQLHALQRHHHDPVVYICWVPPGCVDAVLIVLPSNAHFDAYGSELV